MKPRILLIPNISWWIIGEMGREIVSALQDEFDFYYMPEMVIGRRPDLFRFLLGQVDAVHALNESGVPAIVEAQVPRQAPILSWIHHVTRWTEDHQSAVDHSRVIVVCTPDWACRIGRDAGRPVETVVVFHGVNTNLFRPRAPQRARFGIPPDVLSIGFSAHKGSNLDDQRKGIPILLEVIERLHANGIPFHLSITGSNWENEARRLCECGISTRSLGFLPRAQVPLFYGTIDTLLMTSSVEGGPVTVLEAMACGTPVVATRVGLVPDVVRDGVTGYSADVGDVEGLTQALRQLAASKQLRSEIGREARAFIEQNRTWRKTLEPLRGVYRQATAAAPPRVRAATSPRWFTDPQQLAGAACVADPVLSIIRRVRRGELQMATAMTELCHMLEGCTLLDFCRGAGLVLGTHFKAPAEKAQSL